MTEQNEERPSATVPTLVILVRGWTDRAIPPPEFRSAIGTMAAPGSVIAVPDLPMGMWSTADAHGLCDDLCRQIEALCRRHKPASIVIVAFSAGTLIARGALLCALEEKADWLAKVDRVVFLAGILRGWTISSATPARERFLAPITRSVVTAYEAAMSVVKARRMRTFIAQCERGEPFVVDLRLRYIAAEERFAHIPFVYILGTKDEFISPADAVDVGPKPNFCFLELSGTNHLDMYTVSGPFDDPKSGKMAEQRLAVLKRAVTASPEKLRKMSIDADHIDDYLDPMDRPSGDQVHPEIRHVVIVLHGIRDEGFWTKRIARAIKDAGDSTAVRAPSPSYGYFSILNFLNVSSRYNKTRWLLEQYAEARTLYPNADISFVGHSNGTFLAANALKLCRSVRFKHIYFAGSVVRRDFPWDAVGDRVEKVVNVRAGQDYVVACAPAFVEELGVSGLGVGGAGFFGFPERNAQPAVANFGPFDGGHGMAIGEDYWHSIASFVHSGTFDPPMKPGRPINRRQVWGRRAFLVLVVALLIALGLYAFVQPGLVPWALAAWALAIQIARFY